MESSNEISRFLKKSPIFESVDEKQLIAIANKTTTHHFKKYEVIIREGSMPSSIYIIQKGRAKVFMTSISGKEFIMGLFSKGDVCGASTLLGGRPYPVTIQAVEEVSVLHITGEDFDAFVARYTIVIVNMLLLRSERLEYLCKKLISMASDTACERLAKVLIVLYSKYGQTLLINHNDIAMMSGITPETLSRIVSELEKEGIIHSSRGRIVISDFKRLKALTVACPHKEYLFLS